MDSYDYNADNRKDAVFIIESDEGKQVLMFDGETLCEFASFDKDELAKIGADFTIDSIKSAMDKINNVISGDEGYKKTYAELAKTELSENEGLRFKLIYVDDDDIYYSISETGEVEEDCYRKGFNYDDLDGDGVPSEEEERLAQVCILTEYGFC